ncbi:MAG: GNAT family N-acetyltransferase [Candidatus Heimdallarchaeota archaeon]|nr:MAG: GNAT family N-acetyltransferase [Candidatus Heimdallarchaeota archaeon]
MMKTIITSLTKEYFSSLEVLHTGFIGNFDSPEDLQNFRTYIRIRSHLIKIAIQSSTPPSIIGYVICDQTSRYKARVYSLFVLPPFQRRHVGSNLIQAVEEEFLRNFPDLRYLSVRIPEKYSDSETFFLKQGFNLITKINYYVKNDLSFPFEINPNIEIRVATMEDIKHLVKLERICFSEYWQKSAEVFKKNILLDNGIFFVAFLEGELVGYNFNTVSSNKTEGQYARIATLPKFRRRHIATSLTAKAFEWFETQRTIQRVILTTFAESDYHNAMYQSWGFRLSDQELIMAKNYY